MTEPSIARLLSAVRIVGDSPSLDSAPSPTQPLPPIHCLRRPGLGGLQISVPSHGSGGDTESPTPTDFSPMLRPEAEFALANMKYSGFIRRRDSEGGAPSQLARETPLVAAERESDGEFSPKRQRTEKGYMPRRGRVGTEDDGAKAPASGGGVTARKGPWLQAEDDLLLQLVNEHGPHDWSYIAEHIQGRVGKQCRERYYNHLAPDVRKDAWTPDEDEAIIHQHHINGNKWTVIAKALGNGRSPNSIKNRWHSSLKNKLADEGGEAALLARLGNGPCKCTHPGCKCTCAVACIALKCQCCADAHSHGEAQVHYT